MNYFVSYDLNGRTPTHAQMDEHLKKLRGRRVLETVWYVKASSLNALFDYVNMITSPNDRVLVIEASNAFMRNLLVPVKGVQAAWAA